jgi:hypothetical protein
MGLQLLYNDVALATRGATITASTDSTNYPATNLLQPARGTVYRITGTVPATIDLDINIGATLGASFAVGGAAVLNLRSDAPLGFEPMIDVYQSTSPTFAGSPVSSFPGFSVFNGKRDRINKLASGYIAQYWRRVRCPNDRRNQRDRRIHDSRGRPRRGQERIHRRCCECHWSLVGDGHGCALDSARGAERWNRAHFRDDWRSLVREWL